MIPKLLHLLVTTGHRGPSDSMSADFTGEIENVPRGTGCLEHNSSVVLTLGFAIGGLDPRKKRAQAIVRECNTVRIVGLLHHGVWMPLLELPRPGVGLWSSHLVYLVSESRHAVKNNRGDTKRERTKSLKRQRQSQKDQTER